MTHPNEKDDEAAAEAHADKEWPSKIVYPLQHKFAAVNFLAGCRHGRAQERERIISIVRGLFDTERVGVGTYDVDISENSFAERLRAALKERRREGG